ncbi:MAG TPA: gluconokinase [Balneolaceae bacterium]|nr:gluconokinase [Balneolaceae bacterium]
MSKKVIIGVDIGTTSTKTVAYDRQGTIIAKASEGYPLYSENADRAEQDPDEIFDAVIQSLSQTVNKVQNQLDASSIKGVAFSAAMHSLMAVDEKGQPLTPSITWGDQRATKEAERLKKNSGIAIYHRTGAPIHPMLPLTKLIWFKKHDSDIFNAAEKWISVKEYIFSRFFDQYIVDYSIAGATGMFNMEQLEWDEEAVKLSGLSLNQLSDPVSTTRQISGLNPKIVEQTELPENTPFIIGASDGVLANLGAGAIKKGAVACSIGTSGAVRTVVPGPVTDPKGRFFCYALTENQWVIGGPINNGGVALQWVRDNIFDELNHSISDIYEVLMERAKKVQAGANGLLFLPYLTGERAPYWDADMKGVFFGLTLKHDRNDMIRAVLEGVMYQMNEVVQTLREAGIHPREIRATGGFTQSALWRQIMADVFDKQILVPSHTSSACFGAALLGMKALGWLPDFSTVNEMVTIRTRHKPKPEHVEIYRAYKPVFRQLVKNIQSDFSALAEVNRKINQ